MIIRAAERADVARIKRLAGTYLLANVSREVRTQRGFLVSGFSEVDYERFLDHADHFYVLVVQERVEAFVLAYSSDRIQPNEVVNTAVRDRLNRPFVLIKQICVDADARGRGYAKALYDEVAQRSGYRRQCAAVVSEPKNEASQRFYDRLGFEKVMQITAPDGMPREIWSREFPSTPQP